MKAMKTVRTLDEIAVACEKAMGEQGKIVFEISESIDKMIDYILCNRELHPQERLYQGNQLSTLKAKMYRIIEG
jgi:hypothetical protein